MKVQPPNPTRKSARVTSALARSEEVRGKIPKILKGKAGFTTALEEERAKILNEEKAKFAKELEKERAKILEEEKAKFAKDLDDEKAKFNKILRKEKAKFKILREKAMEYVFQAEGARETINDLNETQDVGIRRLEEEIKHLKKENRRLHRMVTRS